MREVREKVEGVWDENSGVEVKWDALKNALCESAKAVLGEGGSQVSSERMRLTSDL